MIAPKAVFITIALIIILSLILALFGVPVRPPPEWLTEWTAWVAEVVAIIVAARVFWEGAKYIARLRDR